MLFKAAQVSQMTEVEQNKYLKVMTTERDIRNQIATARREGREEGSKAIAVKLIEQGIDISVVVVCTGLSRDEIIALKN